MEMDWPWTSSNDAARNTNEKSWYDQRSGKGIENIYYILLDIRQIIPSNFFIFLNIFLILELTLKVPHQKLIMKKLSEKPRYLRKLIDIPGHVLADLKKLAIDEDKSLKSYIQDILIKEVERSRDMIDRNK